MSGQKNEMLHSKFNINYNSLSARFRKGSVIARKTASIFIFRPYSSDGEFKIDGRTDSKAPESTDEERPKQKPKTKFSLEVTHVDIIADDFWKGNPDIL